MLERAYYHPLSSKQMVECICCAEKLEIDHLGIKCPQGHDICTSCTPGYLNEVFIDPSTKIPPKCCCCNTEIPALIFERQLDPTQLEVYHLNILKQALAPGEIMKTCPKCNYFEVWQESSTSNYFYCKKPGCRHVTCTICNLEVNLPSAEKAQLIVKIERDIRKKRLSIKKLKLSYDRISELEESYRPQLEIEQGVLHHQKCALFSYVKQVVFDAIESGEKVPCPQCGLAGRKDDNCTHMTCPKCQSVWCYVCGQKFGYGIIYNHNEDWEIKEDRCPMYLTEIGEIDNRWPSNDQDCLDRFHRYRTLKALEKVIEEIGVDEYNKACEQFDSVKNCGYSLSDLEDPLIEEPLIIRHEYSINNHLQTDIFSDIIERRVNELTNDSDVSDVLFRFDPDILRILYPQSELNQENNSRRGRRAGRRGRGNRGRGGAVSTNESQITSINQSRIISPNESQTITDSESDIVSVDLSFNVDVSGVINTFRETDRFEQLIIVDSNNTSMQEIVRDIDNQVRRPRARRRRRGRGRAR